MIFPFLYIYKLELSSLLLINLSDIIKKRINRPYFISAK